MSKTAVIAFGGNALVTDAAHDSIPEQYNTVCRTVSHLVDLIEQGWRLVISHGNGPQVGFILRRSEISESEVNPVPVDYAVADTQGAIGYMFVKALTNELQDGVSAGPLSPSWRSRSSIRPTRPSKKPTADRLLPGRVNGARPPKSLEWTIMEDAELAAYGGVAAAATHYRDGNDPLVARTRRRRRRCRRRRYPCGREAGWHHCRRGGRGRQGSRERSARPRTRGGSSGSPDLRRKSGHPIRGT
jgi:hypothetical protein